MCRASSAGFSGETRLRHLLFARVSVESRQLLDYAASQKLDTIQFSSLTDYGSLDAANLQRIKDRAQQHGIAIDSGMGCICETSKGFDKKGPAGAPATHRGAESRQSSRCHFDALLDGPQ